MAPAADDVEKPEATLVADNLEEKVARRNHSKLKRRLTQICITSCVIGVFLDPLFLYIPLLNQDLKCLRLDNTLKIIALVLRSFTDLFYVGRIILQVCRFEKYSPSIRQFLRKKRSSKLIEGLLDLFPEVSKEVDSKPRIGKEIWESSIIVDIVAILPLPQVVILIFFPKMMVSGSYMKCIMNFLVMVQYVPRVLPIYLLYRKVIEPFKRDIPLWLKTILSFSMYILASHVLGAFWYFFAAQQMMRCWEHACRYGNGCGATTFNCHDDQTLRNITVLNDLCPINPPDSTLFDFGIYLNVLQSGALWSTDFSLKFYNSFCWGLRNLSSFASNLQPSLYKGEIIFVAFISIIGVILLVYLIGDLQTIDTERLEKRRHKWKIDQKVESWLSSHGIPLRRKQKVMEGIKRKLLENSDFVVVREIRSILGPEEINSCSPLNRLRKVPLLKDMGEEVLVEISEKLKPEKYTRGDIIIKSYKTLEKMLFIVDGRVTIVNATHSTQPLGAGEFYGGNLLVAPLWTSSGDAEPINDESVEALDDVEALVLYATDMERISYKSKSIYKKLCMLTILKKVEIFQQRDEQVLKAISKRLKPMSFNANKYILKEKKPLNMMFVVVRGVVLIESESAMDLNERKTVEFGSFYGEELVHWVTTWVSHQTFPTKLPLSPDSALCPYYGGSVKILALKADDLKCVLSDFTLPTDSDQPPDRLTILKNVERLETMDEEVLKEICGYLEHKTYEDAYIIQKDKPIEMMFFIMSGVVSVTDGSSKHYRNEGGHPNHSGDDLIEHWLQSKSTGLPRLITSPFSFWAIGEVEVLVLKADDLAKVQPGDQIR